MKECFIVFFTLVAIISANPQEADECQLNGDCAVLFEHVRCIGMRLGIGRFNGNVGRHFNDKATSGWVRSGCTLTVFDHDNFGGSSSTYYPGYFSMPYFNDRTTSARCSCVEAPPAPIYFVQVLKPTPYPTAAPTSTAKLHSTNMTTNARITSSSAWPVLVILLGGAVIALISSSFVICCIKTRIGKNRMNIAKTSSSAMNEADAQHLFELKEIIVNVPPPAYEECNTEVGPCLEVGKEVDLSSTF